jgi:hypothetical protein
MSERAKTPRPLPKINRYTDTKPFWDAAQDQRLLLQYCTDTGQAQWFPSVGQPADGPAPSGVA